jgi:hypothetical protein
MVEIFVAPAASPHHHNGLAFWRYALPGGRLLGLAMSFG